MLISKSYYLHENIPLSSSFRSGLFERHGNIWYICTCRWGMGCKYDYDWCDIRDLSEFLVCCSSSLPLSPSQRPTDSSFSVQCALPLLSVGRSLLNLTTAFDCHSVVERGISLVDKYIWALAMKKCMHCYWIQHVYFLCERSDCVDDLFSQSPCAVIHLRMLD